MEFNFPRPVYSHTVPARPRLQIPSSRPSRQHQSVSAPSNRPEKLIITPTSTLMTSTNLSPCAMPEPIIHSIWNQPAMSWTYVVVDPVTEQAAIIDPLLDYDQTTNVISTKPADELLDMILSAGYSITLLLETRLHRFHISASRYLQIRLNKLSTTRPKICTGSTLSQHRAANRLSRDLSNKNDDGYFDHLFKDYEQFRIGNIVGDVVQLPFPDAAENVGYLIGINVFTTISAAATAAAASEKDSSDGWQRLMNLPTLCRVYGGTGQTASQPSLTYEEMRAVHDGIGIEPETPIAGVEGNEVMMEFYATQINIRAGSIPAKIHMMIGGEEAKVDGEMPDLLKIPKKLEALLC